MQAQRTVLCFGDSNTHGTQALARLGDGHRFPRHERWPGVMAEALGKRWHVIEEGLPGRTTVHDDPIEGAHKNGLRALPVLLETHCPIDLVIVMLGTNDLKTRFSVPASDIALSIERLLDAIGSSTAGPDQGSPAVLLVAPCPVVETGVLADMFGGGAVKSSQLTGLLRTLAAARGMPFVDAGAHAKVDPVDGIHLTAKDQKALGTAIANAVADAMPKSA